MTIDQVAKRLVELCRQGLFNEALEQLYAEDALSLEPEGAPLPPARGLTAIREKGRQFEAGLETVHSMTLKGRGRMNLAEICVYRVRAGKIVLEQFFYDLA